MTGTATRRAALIAMLIGTGVACDGRCRGDLLPIESGEYTVVEHLHGGDETIDDWTKAALSGAQLSIDRAGEIATLVYERDGTTYQVSYTLTD